MNIYRIKDTGSGYVITNRYGEHVTGYYHDEADAAMALHQFKYDHGLNEVACCMLYDDHIQSQSIGSTLPEIAGYNKSGLTVVQMVTNRINARENLRGFNKDLVI